MNDTARSASAPAAVVPYVFDAYYFAHGCGRPYLRDEHWLTFFGAIADRIATQMQPRRVLDAGCALGILVEALRVRGMEAEGLDISRYAIDHVHESVRPFCRQASLVDDLPDRYDLIVSIEVLEHMPAPEGEQAIANICRHTDDVLFSSSPSDNREPSHVNVQPAEYWAEQFARHGFYRDVDFDAGFLTPWAVRFRRSADPFPRIVRNYERQFVALAAARHDARSFSVEVQRELARVESERNDLRGALETAGAARQALFEATQQLVDVGRDLEQLRLRAAEAEAREKEQEKAREQREKERETLEADQAKQLPYVRAALEETHAHLTRKVLACEALDRRLAAAEATAVGLEHELRHAHETIARMETSVFWRIRGLWARISRMLGRPT